LGRFYQNDNWSGDPVLERIDRQVAYYFHFLPLARPYTVQWTGRLLTPATGTYTLGLKAISSASLSIDGQTIIEPSRPGEVKTNEINLASGLHDVEVRFLDNQSHSQVYLYWKPPDGDLARIPAEVLFLPQDGTWHPVQ
jgi:beta-glucosidase